MKSKHNGVKRHFSLLLALMMFLSVVPFYASAESVVLTTANVVTYPATSGEIWFGQKLSDGITLNSENALVTSDGTATGTVIPGKWEFIDTEFVPTTAGNSSRANIKFTPEDQANYTGFEITGSRDVTYKVNKTTPVFVDEVNDPVVATDVEQGATLSTSTLSGGKMKNPYTNEIINKSWNWSLRTTVVNSTGEYNISFAGGSGYNKVTSTVLVKVVGSMQETEIIAPETVTVEYSPSDKYGDIPINGAKAVVKGTTTEVPGTFSSKWADIALDGVGTFNVPIVFTPDDTESYIASEGTMSVTVTKGSYKFVDENGEANVPEITLPYGANFDPGAKLGVLLKSMIKDLNSFSDVDLPQISFPGHENGEIAPVGTNTYNVRVRPYNSNTSSYNVTDLQFVLTIEPVAVEMKLSMSIDEEQTININKVNSNDPYPQGTFDIYVDGALYMEDVKGSFPFDPGKSGNYEIKLVYNPVENDPCVVEEKTTTWIETYHRNLTRGNLVMGGTPTVMYGKEVTLTANMLPENFGGWKITDANGNEVTLEGAVMEGRDITFTMPDFDITVEAIDNSADSDASGDIDNIFGDLGDLTEGDSDNAIVNIFNNIIALFKRIITTITEFFRSIGDHT